MASVVAVVEGGRRASDANIADVAKNRCLFFLPFIDFHQVQCLSDIVTTSGHGKKIVTGRLLSQVDNSGVLKGHLGIVT